MFWGVHLKDGVVANYNNSKNEQNVRLHITNAVLLNNSVGQIKVLVNVNNKQHILAILDKQYKQIATKLNYYFLPEENAQFSISGIGEVHLCGYFEPHTKQINDELQQEQSESSESNEVEQQQSQKEIKNLFGQKQQNDDNENKQDQEKGNEIKNPNALYQKGSILNLLQKRKLDPDATNDTTNLPNKVQINNFGIPNVRQQLQQKYKKEKQQHKIQNK